MERHERCETCHFWQRDDDHEGTCCRYPPVLMPRPDNDGYCDDWQQPATSPVDWCGEWQALTSAPAPVLVDAHVLALPLHELFANPGDARIRKAFRRLGLHAVKDLVERRADELLEQKSFGELSLQRVRHVLRPLGLRLHGE